MNHDQRKRFWWRRAKFIERQAKRDFKKRAIGYKALLEEFKMADQMIQEIIKEENRPVIDAPGFVVKGEV